MGQTGLCHLGCQFGQEDLTALTITETLFGRVELGYAADRLGLGTLPSDIALAGAGPIDHSDLWMHNFNIRVRLVKENDFELGDVGVPAITAGIHFKYNDGIADINKEIVANTGGKVDLHAIGYARPNGEDFTLTATKTFPNAFGHPLIVTGGLRLSQAAELGFLGFSDTYHATFEGNVAFLPLDNVLIAYEFRQKTDPYAVSRSERLARRPRGQLECPRRVPDSEQTHDPGRRLRPLRQRGQRDGQRHLVVPVEVRVLIVCSQGIGKAVEGEAVCFSLNRYFWAVGPPRQGALPAMLSPRRERCSMVTRSVSEGTSLTLRVTMRIFRAGVVSAVFSQRLCRPALFRHGHAVTYGRSWVAGNRPPRPRLTGIIPAYDLCDANAQIVTRSVSEGWLGPRGPERSLADASGYDVGRE